MRITIGKIMSHPSKIKGNTFEREIVQQAKERGLDAQRAWGSNGRALGYTEEVDCLIEGQKVQAKRRKKIADYMKPCVHVDVQVIRGDREEALAVIRFSDYLDMLATIKQLKRINNG